MQVPGPSSAPLAAAGIITLGLVPTLGGPSSPLHWAMTAGMASFGVLLWVRARSSRPVAAEPNSDQSAGRIGRVVVGVTCVLAFLVALIVGFRWRAGGSISLLSVAMPVLGLSWAAAIGARCLRRSTGSVASGQVDRPSRRPPPPDRFSPSATGRPTSPEGHISA